MKSRRPSVNSAYVQIKQLKQIYTACTSPLSNGCQKVSHYIQVIDCLKRDIGTLKKCPVKRLPESLERVQLSGIPKKSPAMKSRRPSERLYKPLGKSSVNLMFDIVVHAKINTRYGGMISYELPNHTVSAQRTYCASTISQHICQPYVCSSNVKHPVKQYLNTLASQTFALKILHSIDSMHVLPYTHNTLAPQAVRTKQLLLKLSI